MYRQYELGGIFIKDFFALLLCVFSVISMVGCSISKEEYQDEIETEISSFSEESNLSSETSSKDTSDIEFFNEYSASIDVDPDSKVIKGVEKVIFKNTSDQDIEEVFFNLYINRFNSENADNMVFSDIAGNVYKYGKQYGYMNILNVTSQNEDLQFSFDDTVLQVNFSEPVKPNMVTEVSFNFEAAVPEICHRIGSNDSAMWLGNFLPVLSISENGISSSGIPDYVGFANYNVSVSVPKEYQVIGSGKNNVFEDGDNVTYKFDQKMIRDFAFAIGENYLKKTLTTKDNIDINYYYYSEDTNADKVLQEAEDSLMYLQENVGSYPYEEFNIVETELYFRGSIVYPQLMFVDSEYTKSSDFGNYFCYNMAQQWFFCTMGIDKVSESWLCEGLALYINDLKRFDEQQMEAEIADNIEIFNEKISDINSKVMNSRIEKFGTYHNYFYIEGMKAKIMFYSLNNRLGKVDFERFVKQFYSEFMFKGARKDDMINVIKEVCNEDFSAFFKEWLEGESIPEVFNLSNTSE